MRTLPRTTENERWYRVRGKRRRPRVIQQPGRDAGNPTRSSGPSEAARSEGTEPQTRSKRAQRPREGRGEGQVDEPAAEQLLAHPAQW